MIGVAFAVAVFAAWPSVGPSLRAGALSLYRWSGALNALLAGPIGALRAETGASLVTAFLLGLLAATAPCQLSTGVASLAFVTQERERAWSRTFAFVLARALVLAALGAVAVYVLGGRVHAPGALLEGVRRALGPVMLAVGLVLLGAWRPHFTLGGAWSERVAAWARARGGAVGAFALGVAFSLAFCPTSFFLFFGLTVPMAAASPLGALYPVVYALGVMLPLPLLVAFTSSGRGTALAGARTAHRLGARVAGAVFMLVGMYDTFVYWLL